MAGRVCSDQMASGWPGCWTQKNCESLALINQRLNDWPCVQWCGCCWTQKNRESLALINQRLNSWPCVQWSSGCPKRTVSRRLLLSTRDWMTGRVPSDPVVVEHKITVSRLLLSTRDWMAGRVCSDQIASSCPVVLNAKELWVACSYQPETEWLAACAVIKWPGCGWCWKKRVGRSFITTSHYQQQRQIMCPTELFFRFRVVYPDRKFTRAFFSSFFYACTYHDFMF